MARFGHLPHLDLLALLAALCLWGGGFVAGAELGLGVQPLDHLPTSPWGLFLHNLLSFSPLYLGALSYGATAFMSLPLYGLAQGTVWRSIPLDAGDKLQALWPHGPFELAAMLLAACFGLTRGLSLLLGGSEGRLPWWAFWLSLAFLLLAAWLEVKRFGSA